MERDKKIQLLLDMQEHPEQFSEQELQTMLDDPEVRELMEATAALKQAMISEEVRVRSEELATADDEWQRFAAAHFSEKSNKRGWLKVAASIIGVLMMSGIAFAAIHIVRHSIGGDLKSPTHEVRISNSHQPATASDTLPSDSTARTTVRYNEATLQQILSDMADYYGLTVRWGSEEAKTLRLFYIWNQRLSASEAIEQMNTFERITLELNDSTLTADIQTNSPKQ